MWPLTQGAPRPGQTATSRPSPGSAPLAAGAYGRRALAFEANVGQLDPEVAFRANGQGYELFVTRTDAVFSLRSSGSDGAAVGLRPVGGRRAQVVGLERLPGQVNHLVGSDPRRWHPGIATYARVAQRSVWEGIDIVYYSRGGELEYDVVVAPGADPAAVRLEVSGAQELSIEGDGSLRMVTSAGVLRQRLPETYQEVAGRRRAVDASYVLLGPTEVGLRLGSYDASLPLVVDPVVAYSTYLGGNGGEYGYGIAADAAGNAYVVGETTSTDFPIVNASDDRLDGYLDVFVTKLTPSGSVAYSTYLGGSGYYGDGGLGIAVDSAGNAYVTGDTESTDFPAVSAIDGQLGGVRDAFVTKVTPSGAVAYSTYLGGVGGGPSPPPEFPS